MIPKIKRYENDLYREFIKQQPCCITGQLNVDPHHTKSVGSGGSDLTMIPLSHNLHQEGHNIGWETFKKKYSVDFEQVVRELLMKWIEENMGAK